MPLPASGTVSTSAIASEFGISGTVSSAELRRGAGYVPNHAANTAIPTGATTMTSTNFYGAEKNFTCTITQGSASEGPEYIEYGYRNGHIGSISRSQIGIAANTTASTNIITALHFVSEIKESEYIYGFVVEVTGNTTESGTQGQWAAVYYNNVELETPAFVDYDSINNKTTYNWYMDSGMFPTDTGTYPLRVEMA